MSFGGEQVLVIIGSIVASSVAAIFVGRWSRSDKQTTELATFQVTLNERELRYKLMHQAMLHRIKAIERRNRQLANRYHWMRGVVLRACEKLDIPAREPRYDEPGLDDDDDNGHDGESDG